MSGRLAVYCFPGQPRVSLRRAAASVVNNYTVWKLCALIPIVLTISSKLLCWDESKMAHKNTRIQGDLDKGLEGYTWRLLKALVTLPMNLFVGHPADVVTPVTWVQVSLQNASDFPIIAEWRKISHRSSCQP